MLLFLQNMHMLWNNNYNFATSGCHKKQSRLWNIRHYIWASRYCITLRYLPHLLLVPVVMLYFLLLMSPISKIVGRILSIGLICSGMAAGWPSFEILHYFNSLEAKTLHKMYLVMNEPLGTYCRPSVKHISYLPKCYKFSWGKVWENLNYRSTVTDKPLGQVRIPNRKVHQRKYTRACLKICCFCTGTLIFKYNLVQVTISLDQISEKKLIEV